MKIFLSSVVRDFEPFRNAATRAIDALGYEVVRSENFSASPASPRTACLAEVRAADAVVLLLGARYGAVQENGLSATQEEYREARERCPVFVFVQNGSGMEPREREFLTETEEWGSGHLTARFDGPDDLRDKVTRALHRWQLAQAAGTVDVDEMRGRAGRLIPNRGEYSEARICILTVGGPRQNVLRPAQLDDPRFRLDLQRDAIYGAHPVLDSDGATSTKAQDNVLAFEQAHASLLVAPDASARILCEAREPDRSPTALLVLIEEYVRDRIGNALGFTAELLDRIDPEQRVSEILPVVACLNAGYLGWQTREEHRASHGSVTIGMGRPDIVQVELAPPTIKRGALRQQIDRLAEDFTVLLRRQMKP